MRGSGGTGGTIAAFAVLAFSALLALPAAAGATTFCVPGFHAACPDNGTNVAEPSLEAAMQTSGSDGQADEVRVAAGVYTDPDSFTATGTDPLTVIGAGAAHTELTTSSAANAFVVNLGGRPVTVRDLTIAIPAIKTSGGAGAQLRNDVFENVDIVSRAQHTNIRGISSVIGSGSAFRGGHIYAESGGSLASGISVAANVGPGDTFTVEDATITGPQTGIGLSGGFPLGTVNVRRTRITADQSAISVGAGTANVDNTQLIGPGSPLFVILQPGSDISATINANHVSMSNPGGGAVTVATVSVQSGATGDATVSVTNSATRGYSAKHVRQSSGTGEANVSFSYSNVPATNGSSNGPGSSTLGPGNIDADPSFADPSTNLALLAGSPSIDAADPADTTSEDIDGRPRPQDGDNDGTARSDQGAYEYEADTTPPETTIDGGPAEGSTIATAQPTFFFSSNEPGTFQCKVDAGAFAPCSSPHQLAPLSDGPHTFTVKAVDNSLNEDPNPPSRTFTVKATPPETSIDGGPQNGETIATNQATFTFSSNEPGSFQCKLDAGPFAPCTSPHELIGLADGPHTFTVKALDDVLNEDPSPPSRTFTVDTTPPETTIVSGPGRKAKTTGKARFRFRASEPGSTFVCRFNNKPFRPCSSPLTRRLKRDGRYRFQVRATDGAGNVDPTPAKRAFKVKRRR